MLNKEIEDLIGGLEAPITVERYLPAHMVKLPASAPQFAEKGHCQWCNNELTGKATKYCPIDGKDKPYSDYDYPLYSDCLLGFNHYWYSRPAYVRATFIRDDFTCRKCGLHQMREDKPWLPDMSRLECDHIIPVSRGGETEMGNLRTLCKECNREKGARLDGEEKPEKPIREPKTSQRELLVAAGQLEFWR